MIVFDLSLDLMPHGDIKSRVTKRPFVESLSRPSVRNPLWARGCYDCLPFTLNACSSQPVTYGLHYHGLSSMWGYRLIPQVSRIGSNQYYDFY